MVGSSDERCPYCTGLSEGIGYGYRTSVNDKKRRTTLTLNEWVGLRRRELICGGERRREMRKISGSHVQVHSPNGHNNALLGL